jgi:hypothetical protein
MQSKSLPMMLATAMMLAGLQVNKSNSRTAQLPLPLEVRITEPLHWKNGCLLVSIDRVNRSSAALFLAENGLIVASSGINAVSPSGHNPEVNWYPVYGVSDIRIFIAQPLAPNEAKHDALCVGPTFPVTDMKKETRREVPLRGQLKIYAYYFLTQQDWLTNRSQQEAMLRTSSENRPKVLEPELTTAIMTIPCRESGCNPGCDGPPVVFDGEARIVPDIAASELEWNERGKAINAELAEKLSPCPAP